MDVFKWLDDHSLVSSYIVNDFKNSDSALYLNLEILLVDGTELHVREYVDLEHRKYSFHWQSASAELIARWDNAPHFPDLTTFPHHRHEADGKVVESHDISFDEVMSFIQERV